VADKLSGITSMVGKVTDIVAEIAAAAREQSGGLEQLTTAVAQVNQVTQQNAASSAESSSAALALSGQAEELTRLVKGFRLERTAVDHGPTPRAAAPRPQAKAAARAPQRRPVTRAAPRLQAPLPLPEKHGSSTKANGIELSPEDLIPLNGESFDEF
jgi:methyl-accepting chemotaxis protein